ncbi:MAG: hypothetical protein J0H40_03975 [Rhizobiales bacterium]|nr:hypothetical protein [Hyphomicrobiales bacterium]
MADDEDAELGIEIISRAIANGAAAIAAMLLRDPEFVSRHVNACDSVVVVWPDQSAECGLALMPIKRTTPESRLSARRDVLPCATREDAFALLRQFGDVKLQAELENSATADVRPFPKMN